jgi:putative transposase
MARKCNSQTVTIRNPYASVSRDHRVMIRRGERGIWQRRYWEHTIRDDRDLAAHLDYIHFNPVKHGLVEHPAEWLHSSFHRGVAGGLYPAGWMRSAGEPPETGERP